MTEFGPDASNSGFVKATRHQELVGMEQRLVALVVIDFAAGPARVAVTAQLVHGFGHGLGHRRAFALDHHQRNAVNEQHQVRHDEGLAPVKAGRAVDAILIDDGKFVALRVIPVDLVDGLSAPAIPAGQAIDRDAVLQELGGDAVRLHKAMRGDARDGADGLRQALFIQPKAAPPRPPRAG